MTTPLLSIPRKIMSQTPNNETKKTKFRLRIYCWVFKSRSFKSIITTSGHQIQNVIQQCLEFRTWEESNKHKEWNRNRNKRLTKRSRPKLIVNFTDRKQKETKWREKGRMAKQKLDVPLYQLGDIVSALSFRIQSKVLFLFLKVS